MENRQVKFYKLGGFYTVSTQCGLVITKILFQLFFLFYLNTFVDTCEDFHVPIYLLTNKIKNKRHLDVLVVCFTSEGKLSHSGRQQSLSLHLHYLL